MSRLPRVDFNIEELIQEVQHRPAIWDKSCQSYKDRLLRARMWEEVCDKIIDNWSKLKSLEKKHIKTELQKKWRNVKDTFKKELAFKHKISLGLEPIKKKRQYIHFNALSFLASDINIPGSTSYIDDSDDESDASTEQENAIYEHKKTNSTEENVLEVKLEKDAFDDENSSCAVIKHKEMNEDINFVGIEQIDCAMDDEYEHYVSKKDLFSSLSKRTKRTFEEGSTSNYHSKKIQKRAQDDENFVETRRVHKGFDEDISFAEMLIPMLRKLNDDQKHYAKIEILNVLHKAKNYSTPTSSDSQTSQKHDTVIS